VFVEFPAYTKLVGGRVFPNTSSMRTFVNTLPCAGKVVGYAPKVGTAIEDRLGVVKNVCRWDTASRSFIQRQKDPG
jgi:hypothetical protein